MRSLRNLLQVPQRSFGTLSVVQVVAQVVVQVVLLHVLFPLVGEMFFAYGLISSSEVQMILLKAELQM
jgi:hypothetical protein